MYITSKTRKTKLLQYQSYLTEGLYKFIDDMQEFKTYPLYHSKYMNRVSQFNFAINKISNDIVEKYHFDKYDTFAILKKCIFFIYENYTADLNDYEHEKNTQFYNKDFAMFLSKVNHGLHLEIFSKAVQGRLLALILERCKSND